MKERKYSDVEEIKQKLKEKIFYKNPYVTTVSSIKLRKEDWKILNLCDGERKAIEIVKESGIEEEKAWHSLSYLFYMGLLFEIESFKKILSEKKRILNKFIEIFSSPLIDNRFWRQKIKEITENEVFPLKNLLSDTPSFTSPSLVNESFSYLINKLYEIAEEYFGFFIAKVKMEKIINE